MPLSASQLLPWATPYDDIVVPDSDLTLAEMLQDKDTPSAYHTILTRQRELFAHQILEKLPSREKYIIERRLGFRDGRRWTLEAISKVLHLSKERVRQLERIALKKLKFLCSEMREARELAGRSIEAPASSKRAAKAKLSRYSWKDQPNPGRAAGTKFIRRVK